MTTSQVFHTLTIIETFNFTLVILSVCFGKNILYIIETDLHWVPFSQENGISSSETFCFWCLSPDIYIWDNFSQKNNLDFRVLGWGSEAEHKLPKHMLSGFDLRTTERKAEGIQCLIVCIYALKSKMPNQVKTVHWPWKISIDYGDR